MELVEPQGPAAEIDEAERQRKTGHDDHGDEFAARQCTYLRNCGRPTAAVSTESEEIVVATTEESLAH